MSLVGAARPFRLFARCLPVLPRAMVNEPCSKLWSRFAVAAPKLSVPLCRHLPRYRQVTNDRHPSKPAFMASIAALMSDRLAAPAEPDRSALWAESAPKRHCSP